ncbi:P-loop containing nucleoside triphosphate hydrolase protein [Radiomyces spectabilis]|uniref:P-loop containing nucleoside triphosphate hydrolase protein n=1 Tax=Radiomyces spectabilis TaxID=64574 RepID=UPI00221E4B19|nr:P-loop containing nucleoside triphosphate hydrolase protein [Radiomyces spectabilis]KAI8380999.1 P-loop containing nucleoside triphosphate hydrolase protein [Radiomyces spectabilis]
MASAPPPPPPLNNDINAILAPILSQFSFPQLESVLYAYLPTRIDRLVHKTGIYAVDTFVVTASVTLVLVAAKLLFHFFTRTLKGDKRTDRPLNDGEITVVIEPTTQDDYRSTSNIFHQALSFLISEQAQTKSRGRYTLKPDLQVDHDALEPPAFNMQPQPDQEHIIEHDKVHFRISFEQNGQASMLPRDDTAPKMQPENHDPSIRVTTVPNDDYNITVSTIATFLTAVAKDYIHHTESLRKLTRSRYDYTSPGKWTRTCTLYETQGLDTVALSPETESLIRDDLQSFMNNQSFYQRTGFPYRRGYLLHGNPGTGKTSLIFAIASALKRHLYFINLNYIDTDAELVQAFINVPANAIVAFEDIDTMTTTVHKRSMTYTKHSNGSTDLPPEHRFNLSTFLSILDGHTLEDGIIFIMTTNHHDILDPAIVRPGRMDVHLHLTYATHYQIRRIYTMVIGTEDGSTLDNIYAEFEQEIPEFVIPPSEIMQTMVAYRHQKESIRRKLRHIAQKYKPLD